jgi:hypothetical protein
MMKLMWFARKWMKLEIIVLSEINQTWKDKYCMFSLKYGNQNLKKQKGPECKGRLFEEETSRRWEGKREGLCECVWGDLENDGNT